MKAVCYYFQNLLTCCSKSEGNQFSTVGKPWSKLGSEVELDYDLKIWTKRNEKEIQKLKDKKLEEYFKTNIKRMTVWEGYIFRDNIFKKQYGKDSGTLKYLNP
jgi:hypothetical protein